MKKKLILALVFSILISSVSLCGYAAEGIMAVDGNVTISCETEASEGTPVAIFILPQILDGTEDVTAKKVSEVTTLEKLMDLNPEYVAYEKAGEDGVLTHICEMKDSLPTGKCVVVVSFIGQDAYKLGEFEHVGKNDINALLEKFNSPTATSADFIKAIDEDINGTEGEPAKDILAKSSADIAYYSSLDDKTAFCNLLSSFKTEEDFTLVTLVENFNKTGVWLRLRLEDDTLSVLNAYNGEGIGKYWNISIDEDSDFASLSSKEKEIILSAIKGAELSDKEKLAEIFTENVVLSMFREVDTREELEEMISSDSPYEAYFKNVRSIITDADLGSYETDVLYNEVLEGNKNIKSISDIEDLFESSIPEEDSGNTSSGTGGSSGGSSVSVSGGLKNNSKGDGPITTFIPAKNDNVVKASFADVDENHWANEYIVRLTKSGVINGVGENKFAPQDKVTRQDFVKILIGALKMELSNSKNSFADVQSGSYYEKYITTAYEKGFISGIDDNRFGVGQNISRQDAAVILSRVLSGNGIVNTEEAVEFKDNGDISDYAKDAVSLVSSAKIFGGNDKGQFNPKDGLTRAEACAIICRLMDLAKGE